MSKDLEDRIEETVEKLRTERDELRVRMHLAAAKEQADEAAIQKAMDEGACDLVSLNNKSRLKAARKEAAESSGDVLAALDVLGDEISGAYRRIRDRLKG